jgi:hypothetical protein
MGIQAESQNRLSEISAGPGLMVVAGLPERRQNGHQPVSEKNSSIEFKGNASTIETAKAEDAKRLFEGRLVARLRAIFKRQNAPLFLVVTERMEGA